MDLIFFILIVCGFNFICLWGWFKSKSDTMKKVFGFLLGLTIVCLPMSYYLYKKFKEI